jgi:hypothetical protein
MPKCRIPSHRLHKATGQAVVVLNGRIHYLGKFDSSASIATPAPRLTFPCFR